LQVAKKKKKRSENPPAQRKRPQPTWFDDILQSRYYFWYYALVILVMTIVLFSKFVFSDKMLFGSDTLQAGVFFREFFVEYFKAHGSVPQWDPYIFGGLPFVDAFHGDIFYPVSFVFKMLFPLFRALGWVLVFHIFLAGISMFLCARAFKLGNLASTFAGILYMFAPYLVSLVAPGHDGKIFVTALFPFAIMFLERGMERKKYLDFVGLGTIVGLMILTPHVQMAYFSLWGIGSYFLFKLIFRFAKEKSVLTAALLSGMFVLAIMIGLALSAIQFYPGYKYTKEYSPRAEEGRGGYEWATTWSLHEEELIGIVIPLFSGVDASDGRTYWGRNPFKDNSEGISVIALAFSILCVMFYNNRRKWYFLGMAAVSLIYALGATTPLFYIFYYLVPNVKTMRAPSMIMFLFSFSAALLAGMGMQYVVERLRADSEAKRKKFLSAVLAIAVVYGVLAILWTMMGSTLLEMYQSILYGDIDPSKIEASKANMPTIQVGLWLAALFLGIAYVLIRSFSMARLSTIGMAVIVVLAIVGMWRVDSRFIDTFDPMQRFGQHSAVSFLKNTIGYDRVMEFTSRIFGSKDYFAYHGIPQVAGYHGNQLAAYDKLIGGLLQTNLIDSQGVPKTVANLLSARYLVYPSQVRVSDSSLLRIFDQNGVAIYKNMKAVPRTFIVHDYGVRENVDSTVAVVSDPRFLPQRFVILDREPSIKPERPTLDQVEDCQIIEYDPGYVKIAVMAKAPGIVCLTDSYYPAWKAYVGGEEVEVYRADGALRAVCVPAGEHVVEFVYDSETDEMSKNVTYATILFILLSFAVGFVVSRVKRGRPHG
jgi:hypothetical protein